ncbi:uncharacterized protein LOC123533224 [Mercenaria mercenaria]|uniref:uncharacterized protein LOC123533224 n=1 Tax=Mercenaria mercenaria TaxID=6596 RepID=UPI00234FB1D6|nr:uncharacterized protein LOC123533224 [Mercenaria mercenaria]
MACKAVLCEPCLYVETEIEAVGFCSTCAECLCSKCVVEHRKAKTTRNHSIQQNSIPENIEIIQAMNEMMTCPVHREMKIAYRCDDHGVCVCTVCRVDTHRNCDSVYEIAKTMQAEKTLIDIRESFAKVKERMVSLRKQKEENKTSLYQNKTRILGEQEEIIQQNIDTLEELKVRYRAQTNEKLQAAVLEIDQDIESADEIERSNARSQDMLKASMKYGDNDCSKIMAHLLTERVMNHKELANELQRTKNKPLKLKFESNLNFISVSSLGTLSVMHVETNEAKDSETNEAKDFKCQTEKTSDEIPEKDQNNSPIGATVVKTPLNSLPLVGESFITDERKVYVRGDTDKKLCSIIGSVILETGHLVLIDKNNSNIKLLSSDFIVLDILRLPGKPVRMCVIRSDMVAVSFERLKRINRYLVKGNAISYEGGFPTALFNHGIAFDGTNIVAIMSDEDFSQNNNAKNDTIQVELRDAYNGKITDVIQDFRSVGFNSSALVLNNTQAVRITEDKSMIIAECNRVLCFDLVKESPKTVAKERRFYVCSGELPKGSIEDITADRNNIYVCTTSGHVLQICASDYSKNRAILSDIGVSVWSISVDSNRIILGCFEDNCVRVYTFRKNNNEN